MVYKTQGVCSKEIHLDVENGIVRSVSFTSGCEGNLQGLSRLAEGMRIEDLVDKIKGIRCGGKSTSCPDQLAKALEHYMRG